MTPTQTTSWPQPIRHHLYDFIILIILLGIIFSIYVVWQNKTTEKIMELANDYHLTSATHYLKASEELRHIQSHIGFSMAKQNLTNYTKINLDKLQQGYSEWISIQLFRQEINYSLHLEQQFNHPAFLFLSSKLKQQLKRFESASVDTIKNNSVNEQLMVRIDELLITLRQIEILHSTTRNELLNQLKKNNWQQTLFFFIFLLVLLFNGYLISKRSFTSINAIISDQEQAKKILAEKEQLYRNLVETSSVVSWEFDLSTLLFTFMGPQIETITGFSPEEWVDIHFWKKSIHPDDNKWAISTCQEQSEKGNDHNLEYRLIHKDGSTVWVRDIVNVIREHGKSVGLRGYFIDITQDKLNEQRLHDNQMLLTEAQKIAHLGNWEINSQTNKAHWSDEIFRIFDIEPTNNVGPELLAKLLHPDDKNAVLSSLDSAMKDGHKHHMEYRIVTPKYEVRWIECQAIRKLDKHGKLLALRGTVQDISERKKSNEEIYHQAHFDNLTNLPNRFLSLNRLEQSLIDAKRNKELVAVLFLDLDDFKKINDTLGHEAGDKILINSSDRLRHTIRNSDTVGRLGGDEFIILLGGLKYAKQAQPVVENLINSFRAPYNIDNREIILTTSIGVAIYPADGNTVSELLRNADSAMYHSKALGRNTYSYYTDAMNRDVSRRLALEEQMHGALERGEFEVFFQVKIDISTGKTMGAEALLRWFNPALGNITPDEFIPIAEQTGLIISIGEFVLNEALAKTNLWQTEYEPDFHIAVNLSPRQFRDPELVGHIK